MKFAKRVYLMAALYGIVVLLPQYFAETRNTGAVPSPVTQPEYYYGFIGVALAWQIAFLVISSDPERFRPLMVAAIVEKGTFAVAIAILYAVGRTHGQMLAAGTIDAVLGVLFVIAFFKTPAGAG